MQARTREVGSCQISQFQCCYHCSVVLIYTYATSLPFVLEHIYPHIVQLFKFSNWCETHGQIKGTLGFVCTCSKYCVRLCSRSCWVRFLLISQKLVNTMLQTISSRKEKFQTTMIVVISNVCQTLGFSNSRRQVKKRWSKSWIKLCKFNKKLELHSRFHRMQKSLNQLAFFDHFKKLVIF